MAEVVVTAVGASATVRVSETLLVTIGRQSSVFYIGNPTVTQMNSGSGTLQQIEG